MNLIFILLNHPILIGQLSSTIYKSRIKNNFMLTIQSDKNIPENSYSYKDQPYQPIVYKEITSE
jgi:hypothetical protein